MLGCGMQGINGDGVCLAVGIESLCSVYLYGEGGN